MGDRIKNAIYTAVILVAMLAVYLYRQSAKAELIALQGTTMGPITYSVKYFDKEGRNFKTSVDSLLGVFNQSLNTYIPDSEISTFNKDSVFNFRLPFFYKALNESKKIYEITDGAFDPSIGPLINNWGFGYTTDISVDSAVVDSLKTFVGMDKVEYDQSKIWKKDARLQLDFSASAKGYGVDVVVEFLKSRGVNNAFVEIGGEVRCIGRNMADNRPWTVAVLHPDSKEEDPFAIATVALEDQAMATSGNYFNYHIIDGVKYGHTIDPKSGFPVSHSLLSASVIAEDCLSADALATAFMVMGYNKSIGFLQDHAEYQAFLVYNDNGKLKQYATEEIKPKVNRLDK